MRLVRVEIPEFRALKDVDITFEPDFYPQVFPVGSLNGGGKSTLLQLIFVLLNLEPDFSHTNIPHLEDSYFNYMLLTLIDKYAPKEELTKLATIVLLSNDNIEYRLDYLYGDFYRLPSYLEKKNVPKNNYIDGLIFCKNSDSAIVVLASIENADISKNRIKEIQIIKSIKQHVFLISPSNQSYLFSTQEERRLLYTSDGEKNHDQVLKRLKISFPNFYTYDFIDVLTEVFRLARDKDYNERLQTGIYGTHSEQIENAINNLFIDGKKIAPLTVDQKRHTKDSIQSMSFKLPSGEEIYPEDLSHGELKRLAIFILFKYYEIQDAIILMDEIENGFHPDWQYTIVRDLIEWGKNNQYILATHSYELCTAVTPAHVKELEPRLIKN